MNEKPWLPIHNSEYLHLLKHLNPKNSTRSGYRVLDLFAGCGGLALGFEAAGFETLGFEKENDAVQTYNKNLSGACYEELLTLDTEFPDADCTSSEPFGQLAS